MRWRSRRLALRRAALPSPGAEVEFLLRWRQPAGPKRELPGGEVSHQEGLFCCRPGKQEEQGGEGHRERLEH